MMMEPVEPVASVRLGGHRQHASGDRYYKGSSPFASLPTIPEPCTTYSNDMTQDQIRQLEKELWDAADALRANSKLTAAEYKDPVLGLVMLRFAQNRYEEAKPIVEAKIPTGPRGKRAATKEDYLAAGAILLPEEAKYEFLAALPEGKDIAAAINNAMKLIEAEYPDLQGNLPKNYQEFESDLLRDLVRVFNKDAVKRATGDVFGRIYEYFLMKFSMQGAGAQEGGEFFTPPSLVQLIVNFIQPDHGIIHDPACGSGGMFVQTGYFVRDHTNQEVNEAIKCYGTEQKTNNTRLAKINLAIHGIEGKIIESNSFYSDPHDLVGKCDFVMANPPFNVNKVDKEKDYVKNDPRLPFGLPKADNGNYLWMQYFYSYLNPKGRAGFVMASSATDAGHSEKLIRQQLIETGAVDCIVSVGNNFFYTRSLPCHVWFYDKGKRLSYDSFDKRQHYDSFDSLDSDDSKATGKKSGNQGNQKNHKNHSSDTILMLDARNVFRKVTTTINDFSEDQLEGLTAIMQLYRGVSPTVSADNTWFWERFPTGEYQDIEGLCKIVTIEEVKANDWSLTPGRYVGVTASANEDFDYAARLIEIQAELDRLNGEAVRLSAVIASNLGELV
jgi:type I restriction enzyme M protein